VFDEPEFDVHLRSIGVGGKRKKKGNKPPARISGGGDYSSLARSAAKQAVAAAGTQQAQKIGESIGKSIGKAIGSKIGMGEQGGAIGGKLGRMATSALGRQLQRLIGRGDYAIEGDTTVVNSLIRGKASAYQSFGSTHAEMVIEYREYIGDLATGTVVSTGTFSTSDTNLFVTSYSINPGDNLTFPWLSNIAANYEEYRFDGLIFEFVSTTSPYNANSAMGEVYMTTQDNVTGPTLSTRQQLYNTEMCSTSRLDRNVMYGVECKDQPQNWYFCKASAGSTTPANLVDFGNFYIGSHVASTFPSNSVLGEVWVTYRVRFRGPIVVPQTGSTLSITGTSTLASPGIVDFRILPPATVVGTGVFNRFAGGQSMMSGCPLNLLLSRTSVDGYGGGSLEPQRCSQFNMSLMRPLGVYKLTFTFTAVLAQDYDAQPGYFMVTLPDTIVPYPLTSEPQVNVQQWFSSGVSPIDPANGAWGTWTPWLVSPNGNTGALTYHPGVTMQFVTSFAVQFQGASASRFRCNYSHSGNDFPVFDSTLFAGFNRVATPLITFFSDRSCSLPGINICNSGGS